MGRKPPMPYGVILAALNDAAQRHLVQEPRPDDISQLLNRANVSSPPVVWPRFFTAPLTPRQIANRTLLRNSYPVRTFNFSIGPLY
jgi:hypothetical protein